MIVIRDIIVSDDDDTGIKHWAGSFNGVCSNGW